MKYPFAAIGVVIAGMAASLPARAEPMAAAMLDRLDANHDGQITREETLAVRERLFRKLDRNQDGSVDGKEVEQARKAVADRAAAAESRLGNEWLRMDGNGDGKVSLEEFQKRSVLFELADRDGNGTISSSELDFMRRVIARRAG